MKTARPLPLAGRWVMLALIAAWLATATAHAFYQGGYRSVFKDANDRDRDDYAATVLHLKKLGVNLYGYPAMRDHYVDPDGAMGDGSVHGLERLLMAVSGEPDLHIFAELGERNLFDDDYCESYWLGFYLDSQDIECEHERYSAANDPDGSLIKADWLASLKLAATTLSRLSMTYPNLVGFNVDDFDGWVRNAYTDYIGQAGDYTLDEVRALRRAGKDCVDCNPDFKFWPTLYLAGGAPRLLASDGYQLGYVYPAPARDHDVIALTLRFKLVSTTPPGQLRLSFFYNDSFEQDVDAGVYKDKVRKRVVVHGATASQPDQVLLDEDLWGMQRQQAFDRSIDGATLNWCTPAQYAAGNCAENAISIGLYRSRAGEVKFMKERQLTLWNIGFTPEAGVTVSDLTVEETLPMARDEASVDLCGPGDPSTGDGANDCQDGIVDFFIRDTAEYRIVDAVDGIFLVFPEDATQVDLNNYAAYLDYFRNELGADKDLIVVHYAELAPHNISPRLLKDQFELSRDATDADGVLFWNPPFQMSQLARRPDDNDGAFASFDNSDGLLHTTWRGYNTRLDGFYQQWHNKVRGDLVVTVGGSASHASDMARVISNDRGDVYFYDDGTDLYCDPAATLRNVQCPGEPAVIDCSTRCYDGSGKLLTPDDETIRVHLPRREKIFLGAHLVSALSNTVSARWATWDTGGNAAWRFESGTTDPCYAATFDALTDAFARKPDRSYGGDADHDDLADCIDPQPTQYNTWYWLHDTYGSCLPPDLPEPGGTYQVFRGTPVFSRTAQRGVGAVEVRGVKGVQRDIVRFCREESSTRVSTIVDGVFVGLVK